MIAKRKREERRQRVSARKQVENEESARSGSNYLRVPEGLKFFSPKAEKYRLDFMAFIAGKHNPNAEEGEPHYERTFYIHRNIGPNQEWHLCAAKSLNRPCPICEDRARMMKDPQSEEDVIKELAPKKRQLFLVRDLSEPGDLLLWEMSFHLFGKQLIKEIASADEDEGLDYFADPEEGQTVRVMFEQSDMGKWFEASSIRFTERKTQYSYDDLDENPCLDEMLLETSYEKLKHLYLEIEEDDDGDDDDDPKPARRRKAKSQKSDDDDEKARAKKRLKEYPRAEDFGLEEGDTVEYKGDLCEIVRISRDGTSLTLEDGDGDTIKAVGADEVSKPKPKRSSKAKREDDDEDSPKPKRSSKVSKSKSKPKPEKGYDGDDDDIPFDGDDDEDDEPPKKKPKPKSKPKPEKGDDGDDDDDDGWDAWDDDDD